MKEMTFSDLILIGKLFFGCLSLSIFIAYIFKGIDLLKETGFWPWEKR